MFEVDEIRAAIDTIALQAINLSDPENIAQGRENLKGLALLVISSCSRHGVGLEGVEQNIFKSNSGNLRDMEARDGTM